MFRIIKHLKPVSTRLIVCLSGQKKIARGIFQPKVKNSEGTPPLGSATFFSPSGATGVKILKKAPEKKIAFLNWKPGIGFKVGKRGQGFKAKSEGQGLKEENKRLRQQLENLAEVAKTFICVAATVLRDEDVKDKDLILKESLVSLEYAIKLAENKAWRSTDE